MPELRTGVEGRLTGWLNTNVGESGRYGYQKLDEDRWQCKECGNIVG